MGKIVSYAAAAAIFGVVCPCIFQNANAFDTEAYCRKVAEATGGSYRILERCIAEENKAKKNLGQTKETNGDFKYYFSVSSEQWGKARISVKEGSFDKLGPATTLWMSAKTSKPKYFTKYKDGNQTEIPYYTEVLSVAVACDKSKNSKEMRMLHSGSVILSQIYLGKNGEILDSVTFQDKYDQVKSSTWKQGQMASSDVFSPTFPKTWGAIYYDVACKDI